MAESASGSDNKAQLPPSSFIFFSHFFPSSPCAPESKQTGPELPYSPKYLPLRDSTCFTAQSMEAINTISLSPITHPPDFAWAWPSSIPLPRSGPDQPVPAPSWPPSSPPSSRLGLLSGSDQPNTPQHN